MEESRRIVVDGKRVDFRRSLSDIMRAIGAHDNQRGGRPRSCNCNLASCRTCRGRAYQAEYYWRKRIIARDGSACVKCGAVGINVRPVVLDPAGDPNWLKDISTGTVLCSRCADLLDQQNAGELTA